jgi:hypothetical protein
MNKLIKEIQFHLNQLEKDNIDKDDFVNAITEICSEEEIINEIIELKTQKTQTQEIKLRIQKLQQQLNKLR